MIILASNSELRKLIIQSSEFAFKVVTEEVDEREIEQRHPNKTAEEIVEILALAKAKVVAAIHPNDLVIAADTFAILPDGTRLHKTKSFEESIQLSMQQSGKTMKVNTGVAMMYKGEVLTDLVTTNIKYLAFDEATVRQLFEINQSAKRRNAALGFFTDAPGFTLVEKIEGSYLGALGLPMEIVRKNIEKLGYTQST
jgi:septum formation protein